MAAAAAGTTDSSSAQAAARGSSSSAAATSWTKIVRGPAQPLLDSIAPAPGPPSPHHPAVDPAAVVSDSSMIGDDENVAAPNGNAGKKPAWSSPSNGPEAGASMETQSWPPLAESVKAPSKPSSDAVKALADGLSSVSVSQGTETAPPQKQAADPRHVNASMNHSAPVRQRLMRRNGAASSGGVLTQAPPLLEPSSEMQPRLSPRYNNPRGNFASQAHGGNDHPRQQRNSFRNRNGGMHTRGDGFHHQNFGGRHDQEHNQDWNSHRSFGNSRDQQQRAMSIRPPPPPPIPYAFPPSPVWSYGPMGFPEVASPLYYVPAPPQDSRGVPFPLSPQQVYFPPTIDPLLPTKILHQIEYYFSEENLIKDTYLRQNMDDQGWVSISLIAGFKKVSSLTDNINLILDSIQASIVVEVQGDKVRKRKDWIRWIMPSSFQVSSSTAPQAP